MISMIGEGIAVDARGLSNTCEWSTAGSAPVNGGSPCSSSYRIMPSE
jgi:hypothetical protein